MNFIDLFAGAGGLSEGFIRAGFKPIAHVEMDKAACFTLKTRASFHYLKKIGKQDIYEKYLKGEIFRQELYSAVPAKVLSSVINLPIGLKSNFEINNIIKKRLSEEEVDLIIGGPPCQAYSLVGRARSKNGMDGDPRNYLYYEYANYLAEYKPKMFVFENVLGLKSANRGRYLTDMEKLFKQGGYNMKLYTVEANNFGVLQNRKRVIIIGWRKNLSLHLPDLEAIKNTESFLVLDVLSDLKPIQAGEGKAKSDNYFGETNIYLQKASIRNGLNIVTQHVARPNTNRDKIIYKIAVQQWNRESKRLDYNDLPAKLKTHKNRHSFFDRFKVVAGNLSYSQTVVAHIAKDGHYYIHPDIKQNRSISVREAARLQSFPDDFYFEGVKDAPSRTSAFKQIGNAVPPLMAEKIAYLLKKCLRHCKPDH